MQDHGSSLLEDLVRNPARERPPGDASQGATGTELEGRERTCVAQQSSDGVKLALHLELQKIQHILSQATVLAEM